MSTTPSPLVAIYAPDGTLGKVPYERLHEALQAGGKMAVQMQAPDGTPGYIPADKTGEAVKAGGKIIPFNSPTPQTEGFWKAAGETLSSLAHPSAQNPYPGMGVEAKQAAAQQAAEQNAAEKQAGYSQLYRLAAPVTQSVGADVPGMEKSAAAGDTAGVLGHTAGSIAPIAAGEAIHQNAPAIAEALRKVADKAPLTAIAGLGAEGEVVPPLDAETVRTRAQAVVEGKMKPAAATSDTPAGKMASAFGIKDAPPPKLLTQAIKPLASNTGWDKAIASAAPDMKAAEVQMGHPIAGVDDTLKATTIAKKGIWQQYAAKLEQASTPKVAGDLSETEGTSASIDGNEVADAMVKSIDKRTALQNPGLAEKISQVADTYRRDIPVGEAEEFLQSANNDLHNYYAKNKVGRQVAEADPATGHVVAEADQLRDSLYSKLDELTGPGAKDLKARYGALTNVETELMRRKNVAARQQPESLTEQLTMARAYGKIGMGVVTASPSSILEGTQSIAAAKWLKERGTTDAMITRAFEALGGKQ